MNELFSITYDNSQNPKVSARELHSALEIEKRFSAWFETNGYGFVYGEDFTSVLSGTVVNNGAHRDLQDYSLSVDMAKHICLMSRTEKGKECRQHLIDLEKAWNTPEQIFARALIMAEKKISDLSESNRALITEVNVKNQVIGELKPKADYTDRILKNQGLVTTTQIAKDYGMSAYEMNNKLHGLKIQFKQSGQWLLYKEYHGMGYTHSETVDIVRTNGMADVKMNTKWTQKGRLFLYDRLKADGVVPVIEMDRKKSLLICV